MCVGGRGKVLVHVQSMGGGPCLTGLARHVPTRLMGTWEAGSGGRERLAAAWDSARDLLRSQPLCADRPGARVEN